MGENEARKIRDVHIALLRTLKKKRVWHVYSMSAWLWSHDEGTKRQPLVLRVPANGSSTQGGTSTLDIGDTRSLLLGILPLKHG